MIHELSEVQSLNIGHNTDVWQFSVILKGAIIGDNCNINCHVFIENDVLIGNNVTVKAGNYLWDGLTICDDVFLGPNVTFTNDKLPRSKQYKSAFQRTVIKNNASIGGGATILGGVEIGQYAMIGAGTLITKNVPDRALVYGNPASIKGWLNEDGSKMRRNGKCFIDAAGLRWEQKNDNLIKI